MLLEVCAYNIESCKAAEARGAGRIELCADPFFGGTTPSYGMLQWAIGHLSIPVFPMIRPRGGSFLYSEDEIAVMKADILCCRQMGFSGVVAGVALPGGQLDATAMRRIVEWAHPMQVTCHKVFDAVPHAAEALQLLMDAGCERVLTSGLKKTATEGAETLRQLIAAANSKIIVMPGGGVRSGNLEQLVRATGAQEYHSSGIVEKDGLYRAEGEEISSMVRILEKEGDSR